MAPASRLKRGEWAPLNSSPQVLFEKRRNAVERDLVQAVVQIDVAGAGDDQQFLRFGCGGIGGFTEVARVGLFAMNEKDRPRRDFLNVAEDWHVHERQRRRDRP